jgi:hypothetical protein
VDSNRNDPPAHSPIWKKKKRNHFDHLIPTIFTSCTAEMVWRSFDKRFRLSSSSLIYPEIYWFRSINMQADARNFAVCFWAIIDSFHATLNWQTHNWPCLDMERRIYRGLFFWSFGS